MNEGVTLFLDLTFIDVTPQSQDKKNCAFILDPLEGFSFAVKRSLLAHLAPSLLPCVLFNEGRGDGETPGGREKPGEKRGEKNAADFGKSATSHWLPCGHI